jgi:hypothetical protein
MDTQTMKKNKKSFTIILLAICATFTISLLFEFSKTEIPEQVLLSFPNNLNLRQGLNQCGPFAAMAVLWIKTDSFADPQELDQETGWKVGNNMTLPWGIERVLKERELKTSTVALGHIRNKEHYLKLELSKGNPVILLNKTDDGILHWFTLVGYTKDVFYLYDSYQDAADIPGYTIDDNGALPGNRTYSTQNLLTRWANGRYSIFHHIAIKIRS